MTVGRIEDLPVPEIIKLMGMEALTGTIAFRQKRARKEIDVLGGSMVATRTNQIDESLGYFLMRKGCITYQQHKTCSEHVTQGKRLGNVLVEGGLLKQEELYSLLHAQAIETVLNLFDWTEGEFEFRYNPSLIPPSYFPPVSWRELVLLGVRRLKKLSKFMGGIGGISEKRFRSNPDFNIERLPLSRIDIAVLNLFRDGRSLLEALGDKAFTDFDLLRSFWSLSLINAIEDEGKNSSLPPDNGAKKFSIADAFILIETDEREEITSSVQPSIWFFPEILRQVRQERRTGLLELKADGKAYWFFITEGDVFAAGAGWDEDISFTVKHTGKLGILDVAQQVTRAGQAKAWFKSSSSDTNNPPPCMDSRELLFHCLEWVENSDALHDLLNELLSGMLLSTNPVHFADRLKLGPSEGFVLSMMDGKTSLDDIFKLSTLPEGETAKIVYQLWAGGLAEPSAPSKPPVTAVPGKPVDKPSGEKREEASRFSPTPVKAKPPKKKKETPKVQNTGPKYIVEQDIGQESIHVNALNLFKQGDWHTQHRDHHNAVECYGRAVRLMPDDPIYRVAYARSLARNPRWRGEAEAELVKALELAPWNVEVYLTLGKLYRLGGRFSRAIDILERAVSVAPTNKEVQIELKRAKEDRKPGNFWKRFGKKPESAAPARIKPTRAKRPDGEEGEESQPHLEQPSP
ncbi:DUF4388 domain-containing protein [Acidobacteriota bacterium]